VDVGKSVSRVGGKAQLPAFRAVAGDLRISHSQFEELETFSRFGTRLDEATRKVLERGWRVREILKQPQYKPIPVAEQIAGLLAVTTGNFDAVAIEDIRAAEESLRKNVAENQSGFCSRISGGNKLDDADRETIVGIARDTAAGFLKEPHRANP